MGQTGRLRHITVGDTKLALLEEPPRAEPGSPPVGTALFVPGLTGSKEDAGPALAALAARGYRTLSVDLPGQYQSDGPLDPDRYDTNWLGEMVRRVGDRLRGESDGPLHVIGHSFGGLVCRAAVIDRPSSFASLTLLCSGPGPIEGDRGKRATLLPILVAELGLSVTDPDGAGMSLLYELNLKAKAAADEATEILTETETALERERFTSTSLASLLGMARALMAEPDRTAELAATRLPCFVCCGEADNGWPIEQQRAMAAALGTTLVTIAGAAHSPCLEQPAATTAQLLRLWQELR